MDIKEKIKITKDVIIISGIFCAFMSLLLILNYIQVSRNEPLESEALKVLVERLNSEPDNEDLKSEIRNFDLLARKAYFTSQWQIKTGAWLLFSGCVILGIAIWFNTKLHSKIEIPVKQSQSELTVRLTTQKWLLVTGGLFLAGVFLISIRSEDFLSLYQNQIVKEDISPAEAVKVISVTKTEPEVIKETAGETIQPEISEATTASEEVVAVTQSADKNHETAPVALTFDMLKRQHNTFRGVFGQGISYMNNIPVEWDGRNGKNILWKTEIPKQGYNSPVLWGDKLFLSGADEASRIVYCLDRNSGKILWERVVSGIPGSPSEPPDVTDDTGFAAPSLAVDGKGVYAIFATGDIIAFNLNGDKLWAKNLGVPDNHYGHSSSLMVWDNKVIVQYDTNKSGRLIALNSTDGSTVWDVNRKNKISWASPVLMFHNGKYQIITTSDPLVAGHDLATGNELWSLNCMMGEVGASVAIADGIIFAANEYARLAAIQPGSNPSIIWEENEYLPEASSPVAYQGLLYIATSYGVIACYDIKTGEKHWEHEAAKGFYSSPVYVEGKIYIIDMGGKMLIFKASSEKNIIGEPELGEKGYATPAFSDGRIYLRGEKSMFCIGVK